MEDSLHLRLGIMSTSCECSKPLTSDTDMEISNV